MIEVNTQSPVPVFEQIVRSVWRAIADGMFSPGDRLPAIRDVALSCKVNRNTVAKAYSQLEADGLVVTRPGSGTVVRKEVPAAVSKVRAGRVQELMAQLMVQARAYGMKDSEIREICEQCLRERRRK